MLDELFELNPGAAKRNRAKPDRQNTAMRLVELQSSCHGRCCEFHQRHRNQIRMRQFCRHHEQAETVCASTLTDPRIKQRCNESFGLSRTQVILGLQYHIFKWANLPFLYFSFQISFQRHQQLRDWELRLRQ